MRKERIATAGFFKKNKWYLGSVLTFKADALQTSLMTASRSLARWQRNPRLECAPVIPGSPPSDSWPVLGSRPAVGLRVHTPQKAAGARRLPPKSEPLKIRKVFFPEIVYCCCFCCYCAALLASADTAVVAVFAVASAVAAFVSAAAAANVTAATAVVFAAAKIIAATTAVSATLFVNSIAPTYSPHRPP